MANQGFPTDQIKSLNYFQNKGKNIIDSYLRSHIVRILKPTGHITNADLSQSIDSNSIQKHIFNLDTITKSLHTGIILYRSLSSIIANNTTGYIVEPSFSMATSNIDKVKEKDQHILCFQLPREIGGYKNNEDYILERNIIYSFIQPIHMKIRGYKIYTCNIQKYFQPSYKQENRQEQLSTFIRQTIIEDDGQQSLNDIFSSMRTENKE